MKKSNQVSATGRKTSYTETLPIDIYMLAATGLTNNAVAKAIGVSDTLLKIWCTSKPAVSYALEQARKSKPGEAVQEFKDYVYGKLPENLRELWDKIEFLHDSTTGADKVELLLAKQSVRVRQQIWMHAMIHTNFNASEACAMSHISKRTIDSWAQEDPDFPQLIDEMMWHKKNFFEGGLLKLVKEGNIMATIFANRTMNKDRGYSEKIEVQHTHTHSMIDLSSLDLDVETLLKIETAIKKKQQGVINITPQKQLA